MRRSWSCCLVLLKTRQPDPSASTRRVFSRQPLALLLAILAGFHSRYLLSAVRHNITTRRPPSSASSTRNLFGSLWTLHSLNSHLLMMPRMPRQLSSGNGVTTLSEMAVSTITITIECLPGCGSVRRKVRIHRLTRWWLWCAQKRRDLRPWEQNGRTAETTLR